MTRNAVPQKAVSMRNTMKAAILGATAVAMEHAKNIEPVAIVDCGWRQHVASRLRQGPIPYYFPAKDLTQRAPEAGAQSYENQV